MNLKGLEVEKKKNLVKVSKKTDTEKLQQMRNELFSHLQKVNNLIGIKALPKVA